MCLCGSRFPDHSVTKQSSGDKATILNRMAANTKKSLCKATHEKGKRALTIAPKNLRVCRGVFMTKEAETLLLPMLIEGIKDSSRASSVFIYLFFFFLRT